MTEKINHYTAIKLKGAVAGRSGTGLVDGMDGRSNMKKTTTTIMKKTTTTAGRINACLS